VKRLPRELSALAVFAWMAPELIFAGVFLYSL
jgi:hypothetical protein